MKQFVIIFSIILVIAILVLLFVRSRRPQISFEEIDWPSRKVNFKMSAGGEKFEGTQNLNDTTNYEIKKGDYTFVSQNLRFSPKIQLAIFNKGVFVMGALIDFNSRTVGAINELIVE